MKVGAKADSENPSFELKIHIGDLPIGDFAITEQPLSQCEGIETHQHQFSHFVKSIAPPSQIHFVRKTCILKDFTQKSMQMTIVSNN